MKARDYSKPYRVTSGKDFRLEDINPRETRWVKTKEEAAELLQEGVEVLRDLQEKLYAQDSWALLVILQADGCRGERRHDQARHVRGESAGVPGLQLQGAVGGGARPQFPLAAICAGPGARLHRHLQPLVLRGAAGGEGAPETSCRGRSGRPSTLSSQAYLARPLRRHQRLRAATLSATGSVLLKFFLHVSKDKQTGAVPGSARQAGEELEVLAARPRRAAYWDAYMAAYEDQFGATRPARRGLLGT